MNFSRIVVLSALASISLVSLPTALAIELSNKQYCSHGNEQVELGDFVWVSDPVLENAYRATALANAEKLDDIEKAIKYHDGLGYTLRCQRIFLPVESDNETPSSVLQKTGVGLVLTEPYLRYYESVKSKK